MRGRFRSQLIDHDEYLFEVIRYVHMNPVRARIVSRAGDYRWSSHRFYIHDSSASWIWKTTVRERFGRTKRGIRAFDAFVHEKVADDAHAGLRESCWQPIVGSADLVNAWTERVLRSPAQKFREVPDVRRLAARSIDAIIDAACRTYGRSATSLLSGGNGIANRERQLLLAACRGLTDATNAALGARFGVAPSTVATAVRRTRSKLAKDRTARRRYERLLGAVDEMSNDAT